MTLTRKKREYIWPENMGIHLVIGLVFISGMLFVVCCLFFLCIYQVLVGGFVDAATSHKNTMFASNSCWRAKLPGVFAWRRGEKGEVG